MTEALIQHIERYVQPDAEARAGIGRFFQHQILRKKENLLVEGQICRVNSFVLSGCLRMFFMREKGTEQTTHFALENWWLAEYTSFEQQKPSAFSIQAVEPTTILTLSYDAQEELLLRYPIMERYFRLMHQRAHAAAQFRMRYIYDHTREELYRQFSESYPEFVQRVPQYLLASFLGFTPEYLSEIRSKRIS